MKTLHIRITDRDFGTPDPVMTALRARYGDDAERLSKDEIYIHHTAGRAAGYWLSVQVSAPGEYSLRPAPVD